MRLITAAGLAPVQRDTLYGEVRRSLKGGGERPAARTVYHYGHREILPLATSAARAAGVNCGGRVSAPPPCFRKEGTLEGAVVPLPEPWPPVPRLSAVTTPRA